MINKEELKELLTELGVEMKPEEKKEWPQEGDKYFWVDSWGDTGTLHSTWVGEEVEHSRLVMGNVFKTLEEAKRRVEYLMICRRVKDKIKEVNDGRLLPLLVTEVDQIQCISLGIVATTGYPTVHRDYWIVKGEGEKVCDSFTVEEWKVFFGLPVRGEWK